MHTRPEQAPQSKSQEDLERYTPRVLSVADRGEFFALGDAEYVPENDNLIEKVWSRYFDSRMIRYRLTVEIHGLRYLFRLAGSANKNEFTLSFKTLEYEYATVNLSEEETRKLFESVADFLESAYEDSEKKMLSVIISPADAAYSTIDIDNCIREILENSSEHTEEDLRRDYKGFKIFDLYHEIFNKDFEEMNHRAKSKSPARSRYFRIKFKRFLSNWEIKEDFKDSMEFSLKRKKEN
jgi:hypothetical protein